MNNITNHSAGPVFTELNIGDVGVKCRVVTGNEGLGPAGTNTFGETRGAREDGDEKSTRNEEQGELHSNDSKAIMCQRVSKDVLWCEEVKYYSYTFYRRYYILDESKNALTRTPEAPIDPP